MLCCFLFSSGLHHAKKVEASHWVVYCCIVYIGWFMIVVLFTPAHEHVRMLCCFLFSSSLHDAKKVDASHWVVYCCVVYIGWFIVVLFTPAHSCKVEAEGSSVRIKNCTYRIITQTPKAELPERST